MTLHELLCKPDTHMWALRHITGYLSKADGARLAITAIESGRADLNRLLHWLLHGDAPLPPLTKTSVLFEAAQLGLWPTVVRLLQQIKCDSPARETPTKSPPSPAGQEPCEGLTAAYDGSGILFPIRVLDAAATRGDLTAVQWLLSRTKKGVNTVVGGGRTGSYPRTIWISSTLPS
jgi:hypothetical protein